jgi:NAD(P)-dependent dehydrogenase (short-subunit alcohol dehydrogenase family)
MGADVLSLEGANVVVLGGSSGMGLATAAMARDQGASVTIVGRDPDRLAAAQEHLGSGVRGVQADVADRDQLSAAFEALDRIDHVAMLAGEQPASPVAETPHEQIVRAIDVRVWAAYSACALALPKMNPYGSFTLCSGTSAHRPRAGRSAGAVATGAAEALTRALAVELGPIRVNALCPGAIDTPLLDRVFGEKKVASMRAFTDRIPVPRLGTAEEIADAVCFLMRNTFVTGVVLHVDGGAMLV